MGLYSTLKNALGKIPPLGAKERRGILWLIPLMIILSIVAAQVFKPRFDRELQVAADRSHPPITQEKDYARQEASPAVRYFPFDPNTVDYRSLRELGFSQKAAAGIVRYRESGKVFRVKEDFATCRDVGDSLFYILEPYIRIAPQYAPKAKKDYTDGHIATDYTRMRGDSLFNFDPNILPTEGFVSLGFSQRQATAIIARREQIKGFRDAASFAECYVVSPEMFSRLEPFIEIAAPEVKAPRKVELNTADSVQLLSVSGIGPITAGRIVALRRALGGFARIDQLSEVRGMTEQNYERILQQISLDSSIIQKIDINFALPEKLAGHPYITYEVLRKIVKNRQLKGGWSTTESMIEDGTLTKAQAQRLAPYLLFNANQ